MKRYVDVQLCVTNYWREINKDKPEFEQASDKILEWNKSLKRKGSLFLYWENLFEE